MKYEWRQIGSQHVCAREDGLVVARLNSAGPLCELTILQSFQTDSGKHYPASGVSGLFVDVKSAKEYIK